MDTFRVTAIICCYYMEYSIESRNKVTNGSKQQGQSYLFPFPFSIPDVILKAKNPKQTNKLYERYLK